MKKYSTFSISVAALLVLAINACVPDFTPKDEDRLYFKFIKIPNTELIWFTYSAAFAESPDFVIMKSGEKTDTICTSTNIMDISMSHNNIHILFDGKPTFYKKQLHIKSKIKNFVISIDTLHTDNVLQAPKKYFKLKNASNLE